MTVNILPWFQARTVLLLGYMSRRYHGGHRTKLLVIAALGRSAVGTYKKLRTLGGRPWAATAKGFRKAWS